MSIKRAWLEKVFKVDKIEQMWQDARVITGTGSPDISGDRVGQLCIRSNSAAVDSVYVCQTLSQTTTTGWVTISY